MNHKKSTPEQKSRTGSTSPPRRIDLNGIPVEIVRKRMKTMRLRISRDGAVHLSVPIGVSDERAMLFLSSKEGWLRKNLQSIREKQTRESEVCTAFLTLWGTRYDLVLRESGRRYALSIPHTAHEPIVFTVPTGSTAEHRAAHLSAPLQEEFVLYLDSIFPIWESVTGLHALSRDVRTMKSRWGSCNIRTAHIRMNLRLVHHPKVCTDYVLLHELCHLRVPHHGKDFHALVEQYMPAWKHARDLLNHPESVERSLL